MRGIVWLPLAATAFLAAAAFLPVAAWGQRVEPKQELIVSGRVVGELTRGSRVTFTMEVSASEGFATLSSLSVILTLHDIELESLVVDLDDNAISAGGGRALIGTANELLGAFFKVSGLDVSTTTAGTRLTTTVRASMLQTVPPGATARSAAGTSADDEFGDEASVSRAAKLPPEPEKPFPWGAVIAAVAGALFAGGFVGGMVGHARRPPVRPSVYATVRRRLEEERTKK